MKGTRILALAATVALGLASAPASADVVFNFTQTGATPANAVAFSGALVVSDRAFSDGIDIRYTNSDFATPAEAGLDQLVSLVLGVDNLRGVSRSITEQDFFFQRPAGSRGRDYSFSFTSMPGGGVQGMLRFNDTQDQLDLAFGVAGGNGLFISDRGGVVCGQAPGCGFTFATGSATTLAVNTAVMVPEAASVSLFCTGLVALAGLAMRRRVG